MDNKETKSDQRLQRLLKAAFSGPQTPVKHIPKKTGESRAPRAHVASAASANIVRRRSGNSA
jgi:hypothetical protein